MGIHQETVDSYLEDVILASLDQTSSTKARDIVQQQADKLDSVLVHQQKTAVSDRYWLAQC